MAWHHQMDMHGMAMERGVSAEIYGRNLHYATKHWSNTQRAECKMEEERCFVRNEEEKLTKQEIEPLEYNRSKSRWFDGNAFEDWFISLL